MNINLWYCKHLFKRITRYENIILKAKGYIIDDSLELKYRLKKLNAEDYFKFAINTGYVGKDQVPDKKKDGGKSKRRLI
jgi:hypothetical protein